MIGTVETVVAVDEEGIFLNGWASDVRSQDRIRLTDPTGGSTEVELGQRFARPDVAAMAGTDELHGFTALAPLPPGPLQRSNLRLEIEGPAGPKLTLEIPDPIVDPTQGRRHVLSLLELIKVSDRFMVGHVYPAVERLNRRIAEGLGVKEIADHGPVPSSADVSIVVPIFGRLDLVTPQIALFARDPEINAAELVLVLDSPELEDELLELTHHLHELYRLPMRVVVLRRNSGFGNSSNFGVEHSSSPLVLLLNSDVFPDEPGWLSKLTGVYRTGEVAAVGPKLLFEDGSLQHAGMYFERDPVSRQWQNLHFHKGMPSVLPAANVERRVPALTAACLLVGRDDFTAIDGFDPAYVHGDYEDSDLCLRLHESGRECRYVPSVELYHPERQSFAESISKPGGSGHMIYNRWLFTHRWGQRIESLMEEYSSELPLTQPAASQ